jgi:hypothetical protein
MAVVWTPLRACRMFLRIPGRIGVRPTFLGIDFALSHMTLRAGLHEHSAAAFVESRASSRPPCPQLRRRVPM